MRVSIVRSICCIAMEFEQHVIMDHKEHLADIFPPFCQQVKFHILSLFWWMPRLLFSAIHEDNLHRFLLLTVILWVILKFFASVLLNFPVLPVSLSIRTFCSNWSLIPVYHHRHVYLCRNLSRYSCFSSCASECWPCPRFSVKRVLKLFWVSEI